MKTVDQVKKFYELNREKMDAAQAQALQKAIEYQNDPLYFRGWLNRYFKYEAERKNLALDLYAGLEAIA